MKSKYWRTIYRALGIVREREDEKRKRKTR